ncbi:hypothetical protein [Gryllotalpicola protaetiae]|uniref:Uncharacterized protein n=1 Tax=Gryllotalpicola protaetiae TaxID=2419771 RepID=A0A387BMV8_9MICO|nr:hypothetical protein [Gryllotalpicola protaetiae]AYG05545.1 hypothetical protein D7I44_17870 [Gryllotalpicola protaetiae]
MAPRRLPRGSRKNPATLFYDVEKANKDRWSEIAARAEVSPSALFDRMVETIELDERGLPTWWKPVAQLEQLDGTEVQTQKSP